MCERWFQRFKIGDFDVADKENRSKSTKTWNCKLDEDDSQTQKQLAEQLSVNKLFPIAYEKWKIQKVGR